MKPVRKLHRDCFRNIHMGRVMGDKYHTPRPIWMYSVAHQRDPIQVEVKWVPALNKLGFHAITPHLIARNIRSWMKRAAMEEQDLRSRFNEELLRAERDGGLSTERAKWMIEGDDRAELLLADLVTLGTVLDREPHEFYTNATKRTLLGIYRVYAVFHDDTVQSVVMAVSKEAAIQEMVYELIFGGDQIEKTPRDWFNVSIECALVAGWDGAVEIEELQGWLGRISTRSGLHQKEKLSFPR